MGRQRLITLWLLLLLLLWMANPTQLRCHVLCLVWRIHVRRTLWGHGGGSVRLYLVCLLVLVLVVLLHRGARRIEPHPIRSHQTLLLFLLLLLLRLLPFLGLRWLCIHFRLWLGLNYRDS